MKEREREIEKDLEAIYRLKTRQCSYVNYTPTLNEQIRTPLTYGTCNTNPHDISEKYLKTQNPEQTI